MKKHTLLQRTCAFLILVLGSLVLFGWFTHRLNLIQIFPTFVPMQFNTALCFFIVGLLCLWEHERAQFYLAISILSIATLTLAEYIVQYDIGLDQLFIDHYVSVKTSHPGRMAPNTALAFIFTGSLFLLQNTTQTARRSQLISLLTLCISTIGGMALLGYLLDVEAAYGWGKYTQMAVHTSFGFICLSLYFFIDIITHKYYQSIDVRWFPSIVFGLILFIGIFFYIILKSDRIHAQRAFGNAHIHTLQKTIINILQTKVNAFKRMGKRLEKMELSGYQTSWEDDAKYYMLDDNYAAFEFITLDSTFHWTLYHPKYNGVARVSPPEEGKFFVGAEKDRLILHYPLSKNNRFWAWLTGQIFIKSLINKNIESNFKEDFSKEVSVNHVTIIKEPHTNTFETYSTVFPFFGTEWTIKIFPTERYIDKMNTRMPEVFLLISFILACITAYATRLLLVSVEYSNKLQHVNKQLEESIKKLTAANQDLEQFAYLSSHDLQTPLRAVVSYIEFIKSDFKIPEQMETFFNKILDSATQMQVLILDILEYSRINSTQFEKEHINLPALVNKVVSEIKQKFPDVNVQITCTNLPFIYANIKQAKLLFTHLLHNAFQYRKENDLCIRISCTETDKELLLSVEDNGIGIDKHYFDEIFRPFKRLHSRYDYEGSGIGLAICKRIVEANKGTISVESELDKGTIFRFTLPKGNL